VLIGVPVALVLHLHLLLIGLVALIGIIVETSQLLLRLI
jgi:hypothetical protein